MDSILQPKGGASLYQSHLKDVLSGQEGNYLLPFYWQHGNHTDRIPDQVQRIYDSGARAFCVESRPHKDFCGETWWRDMDLILQEARRRNMKVWILDDDHFPTGHANGAIEHKYPHLRQWLIKEFHVDTAGPLREAMFLIPSTDPEDTLLGIFALRSNNDAEETCTGEPIDLRPYLSGNRIYWDVPEGCWRIYMYFKTRTGGKPHYIDMINPESVRVLIDEVYEPHWAHYASEFGQTIAGFFSDEPSFGNIGIDMGRDRNYDLHIGLRHLPLPWNEQVLAMMTATLGYDPLPYLHALWYEDSRRPALRFAYMDAVTRLYDTCFTGQLAEWCHQHGVEYIGHIIEDMNAHVHLGKSAGHFFRALQAQDMSGIDVVLHQIVPGLTDTIHSAPLYAHIADPEFFDYLLAKLGASLAHLTPHMQGRAMCEIFGAYGWAEDSVLQTRLMDHMLVRGINHFVPHAFSPTFPDPDCPPHFGAEGHDPGFEAYCTLMKYTNQAAHLLYGADHVASAAILYHAEGEWSSHCGTAMPAQRPAKVLYDHHLDYDVVPMDFLLDASVCDRKLQIHREFFGCLIVPYADHLPEKLCTVLHHLHKQGLPVWFVDAVPNNLPFDGAVVPLNELPSRLEQLGLRDISVEGTFPHLRFYHARRDISDVFFFVNEDAAVPATTTVHLPVSGAYTRLDLLHAQRTSGATETGAVSLDLLPGQSQFIIFEKTDLPPEFDLRPLSELTPTFTLELAEWSQLDVFTPYTTDTRWFNVTGPHQKPDFSGKMRYRFSFDAPATPARLFLNLGAVGQNASLKINGVDCGMRICPPYRFDITSAVRPGNNYAEVIVSNTLVYQFPDSFSAFLAIAPSGLLGPVRLEAAVPFPCRKDEIV